MQMYFLELTFALFHIGNSDAYVKHRNNQRLGASISTERLATTSFPTLDGKLLRDSEKRNCRIAAPNLEGKSSS